MDWLITPCKGLRGAIRVPPDKSISHRAAILGAIADGESHIDNYLTAGDTLATLRAMAALGVETRSNDAGSVRIQGVGLHGLRVPHQALDMGNSGTGMRLLSGLLAAQRFATVLVGDGSLSRRPMRRVSEPLALLGANIAVSGDGTPPLRVTGTSRPLHATRVALKVASAQVKSALLLAGLYADGPMEIVEPQASRDHTERMMDNMGVRLERRGRLLRLHPPEKLQPLRLVVPGDLSSAAFWMVAASVVADSRLQLPGVGVNALRGGVLTVLQDMGARVVVSNQRVSAGEPVADFEVETSPLTGCTVEASLAPATIDEFPVLFVAAALARGTTDISGIAELRVKESDRIAVMGAALRSMGAEVVESPDRVRIRGGALRGTTVDAGGDHRCAMALAVAALAAMGTTRISGCDNVATSYPDFAGDLKKLGGGIRCIDTGCAA